MTKLGILFMTKEVPGREGVALRTIEGIKKHLKFDGELVWGIALGNGSSINYGKELVKAVGEEFGLINTGFDSAGKTWNFTTNKIFKDISNTLLRLEDDFLLTEDLDITPYYKVLQERDDVGMVRLGLMPVGLMLESVGYNGEIYFDVSAETPYKYSGNVGLVHRRLHEAVGMFHEEKNPGDIEVDFDNRLRALKNQPKIWMPMLVCGKHTYSMWQHIGEVQSYDD